MSKNLAEPSTQRFIAGNSYRISQLERRPAMWDWDFKAWGRVSKQVGDAQTIADSVVGWTAVTWTAGTTIVAPNQDYIAVGSPLDITFDSDDLYTVAFVCQWDNAVAGGWFQMRCNVNLEGEGIMQPFLDTTTISGTEGQMARATYSGFNWDQGSSSINFEVRQVGSGGNRVLQLAKMTVVRLGPYERAAGGPGTNSPYF